MINYDKIQPKIVESLPVLGDVMRLSFEGDLASILPSSIKQSGIKRDIVLHGQHKTKNIDIQIDILRNKDNDLYAIKRILEDALTRPEFVISFSHIKNDYRFINNKIIVRIILTIELFTNEDYFDTIGRYKATHNSICVLGKGENTQELIKLAEELQIKTRYKSKSELCVEIKQRIETLTWEDFN